MGTSLDSDSAQLDIAYVRQIDASIAVYSSLTKPAGRRRPAVAQAELGVHEERLLTCVNQVKDADPVARGETSVPYRALCALLLRELDQLSDFLSYSLGPDAPDVAVESITGGLTLDNGRASLKTYLRMTGVSRAQRFRLKQQRLSLTDPEQMAAPELHEGQPRTLDYALGTEELGLWIRQVLSALGERNRILIYEGVRGDLSGRDLAELTGLKEGQVSQNKRLAVEQFIAQGTAHPRSSGAPCRRPRRHGTVIGSASSCRGGIREPGPKPTSLWSVVTSTSRNAFYAPASTRPSAVQAPEAS